MPDTDHIVRIDFLTRSLLLQQLFRHFKQRLLVFIENVVILFASKFQQIFVSRKWDIDHSSDLSVSLQQSSGVLIGVLEKLVWKIFEVLIGFLKSKVKIFLWRKCKHFWTTVYTGCFKMIGNFWYWRFLENKMITS